MVNSPWGVCNKTTAPGTSSLRETSVTTACNAVRLIGFNAEAPVLPPECAAELVPGDIAALATDSDDVFAGEHDAVRRAMVTRRLPRPMCLRPCDWPEDFRTRFIVNLVS